MTNVQIVDRENVEVVGYFGLGFNDNLEKPTLLKEALKIINEKQPHTKGLDFNIRYVSKRVKGGCYCLGFVNKLSAKAVSTVNVVEEFIRENRNTSSIIGMLQGYRTLYVSDFLGTPFMLGPNQEAPPVLLLSEEEQEEMDSFYEGGLTHYFLEQVKEYEPQTKLDILLGSLLILSNLLPKVDTTVDRFEDYNPNHLEVKKEIAPNVVDIKDATSEVASHFILSLHDFKEGYAIRNGILKGMHNLLTLDFPKDISTRLVDDTASYMNGTIHLSLVDALILTLEQYKI